eukprot:6715147-Alexandrium_andersonii.AAC.1
MAPLQDKGMPAVAFLVSSDSSHSAPSCLLFGFAPAARQAQLQCTHANKVWRVHHPLHPHLHSKRLRTPAMMWWVPVSRFTRNSPRTLSVLLYGTPSK